ncbi:uncharacterized protein METZ01_LOCUS231610 [marine metagenome]|uniref:Prolyl 4-hydroxylase alpha subunit Fe(2+) 2OG dioxygenase domain-containing protein n=1 Tax=marine metagenome TaxID=408172 RepID=A0A382GUH5_9ZZZZ
MKSGEKKIYHNIISEGDAEHLITYAQNTPSLKDTKIDRVSIIHDIFNQLQHFVKLKFKLGNSFWWIKNYNKGIIPHYDTGNNKHMLWCNLSCSILLSNPTTFEGGIVYFDDGRSVKPSEHYLNALIYSSVENMGLNKHWVDKCSSGNRWIFLMFIETEDIENDTKL